MPEKSVRYRGVWIFVTLMLLLEGCVSRTDSGKDPLMGSRVSVHPSAVVADGTSEAQIEVWALDRDGNPHAGANVVLTASNNAILTQPQAPTDSDGYAQGAVTSLHTGTSVIGFDALIDGIFVSSPHAAEINFVDSTVSSSKQIALVIDPAFGSVDTASSRRIRVGVRKSGGQPAAGVSVALSSSRVDDVIEPRSGETDASGQFLSSLVGTRAGRATIRAQAEDVSTTQASVFFAGAPDSAHTYILIQSGNEVAADGVTANQAQVFVGDQFGNPVPFVSVAIASTAGNIALVPPRGSADTNGIFFTTVITSDLGSSTLLANAGTLAVEQNIALVPGPISLGRSWLIANPNVESADGISAIRASVTVLDAAGHPRANENIIWSSSDPQHLLHPTMSVTDASGEAQMSVTSTRAGRANITASKASTALFVPVEFVGPDPSGLSSTLTASSNAVVAGATPGVRVTLSLKDAFGHPLAQVPVSFSSSEPNALLQPAATMTDASGNASTQVQSFLRGSSLISAVFSGNVLSTSLTTTPAAPDSNHASLSVTTTPLVADGTPMTTILMLQDAYGNAVDRQSVACGLEGGSATLSPNVGITSNDGSFTAHFQTTTAGPHLLTATFGTGHITLPLTFLPGTPNAHTSTFMVYPPTGTADGVTQSGLNVVVRDAFLNACTGQTVSMASNQGNDRLDPHAGVTDAQGRFSGTLVGTQSGLRQLVAGFGNVTLFAPLSLLAGPTAPSQSTFLVSPNPGVADGNQDVTVTLQLRDAFGNPVTQQNVIFSSSHPAEIFSINQAVTDANGVVSVQLTSTTAERSVITAYAGAIPLSANVVFLPGPPSAAHSSLGAAPSTNIADGNSGIGVAIIVRDAQDNPIANEDIVFSVSGNLNFLEASQGQTDAFGNFSTTLKSVRAEVKSVTAAFSGLSLSIPVTFVSGAPSVQKSVLTLSPNLVIAGGQSSVYFAVRDSFENPVSQQNVTITASSANVSLLLSSPTTDTQGIFVAAATANLAGNYNLIANAQNLTMMAQIAFVAGPLDANQLVLSISPNTVVAGANAVNFSFFAGDIYGNPIANQVLNFVIYNAAHQVVFATSTQTATNGVVTLQNQVFPTHAGSSQASLSGGSAVQTANFVTVAGSPNAAFSILSTTPNVLLADGVAQSTLVATFQDQFANPVCHAAIVWSTSGANVTLSPSTSVTDCNGVATTSVVSTAVQSTAISASSANVILSAPITFVVGSPNSNQTSLVISPNAGVIANNQNTAAISVVVRDAVGHPISGQLVTLSSTGAKDTLTPSSGTTNSMGVFAASIKSTLAQADLITANANLATRTGGLQFVPGPPRASNFLTHVTPNPIVAGAGNVSVDAIIRDAFNNTIPNQNTTISFFKASGSLDAQFSTVTDANGYCALANVYFPQTHAENRVVQFVAGAAGQNSTLSIVAGPFSTALSTLTATPNVAITSDVSHFGGPGDINVRLVAVDQYGNPLVSTQFFWTANGDFSGSKYFDTTDAAGTAMAVYRSNKVQTATLGVVVQSTELDVAVKIVAGPPDASRSLFTVAPTTVSSGNSYLLSTTLKDQFGYVVSGQNVTIRNYRSDTNVLLSSAFGQTNASGVYKQTYVADTAVLRYATASTDNNAVVLTAAYTVVAGSPNAQLSGLAISPNTLSAGGMFGVNAFFRDSFSNPLKNQNYIFSVIRNDTNQLITSQAVQLDANGNLVLSNVLTTLAASQRGVLAAVNSNFSLAANFIVVASSPNANQSFVALTPNSIAAGSNVTILVGLRDAYGNAIAQNTVSVSANGILAQSANSGLTDAAGNFVVTASFRQSGNQNVSVTSGNVTLNAMEWVNGGPAYNLVFSIGAKGYPAGIPTDLNTVVFDQWGNVANTYGGVITFSASAANVFLPSPYTFVVGDGGAHVFGGGMRVMAPFALEANASVTASASGLGGQGTQSIALSANMPVASAWTLATQGSAPTACLGLINDDPRPGATLSVSRCRYTLGQTPLFYSDDSVRFTNICLEVPGSNYASGQILDVQACDNGNNKRWAMVGNALMSLGNPNYCVDSTTSPVSLTACSNANAILFNAQWASSAFVPFSDQDFINIDDEGGNYYPDDNVDAYWNNAQWPFRFLPGGQLQQTPYICLDVNNVTVAVNATLRLETCSAAATQNWVFIGASLRPASNQSLCVTNHGWSQRYDLQSCSGATSQNFFLPTVSHAGLLLSNASNTSDVCVQLGQPSNNPNRTIGVGTCQNTNQQITSMAGMGGYQLGLAYPMITGPSTTGILTWDFGNSSPTDGNIVITQPLVNQSTNTGTILLKALKTTWAVVAAPSSSLCSDTTGATSSGNVKLKTCNATAAQSFSFKPLLPRMSPVGQPNLCLSASTTNGGMYQGLTYQTCSSSSSQRFSVPVPLTNGAPNIYSTISSQGLCLDVNSLPGQTPNAVLLQQCVANTSYSQVWNVTAVNSVVQNGQNFCVDGSNAAAGAKVIAAPCNNSQAQNFTMSF